MKSTKKAITMLISSTLLTAVAIAPPAMAARGDDDPDGPFKSRSQQQQNPNQNQKSSCIDYRLSSNGGDAGFRTLNNPKDFRQVSNGSVRGQICTSGIVTIELSKRHPDIHVSLTILGREYTFGQGDRGDKLASNWYRRYFNIDLSNIADLRGGAYYENYAYQGHGIGQPTQPKKNYQQYGNNSSYQLGSHNSAHQYNHQPQISHQQSGYNNNNHLSALNTHNYGRKHGNRPAKHHHDHGDKQHYQLEPFYQRHDDHSDTAWSRNKRKSHKIAKQHKRAHKSGKPHHHHGQFIAYL